MEYVLFVRVLWLLCSTWLSTIDPLLSLSLPCIRKIRNGHFHVHTHVHAHTLRFIVQTYLSVGYINYKIELKCCRASEKSCNKNEAFSIYEASDLQFICLFFGNGNLPSTPHPDMKSTEKEERRGREVGAG